MKFITSIGTFLFLTITSAVSFAAQIEPATLSYQGTLTDSAGQQMTGTKSIQICLYQSPTGASGLPLPDPANGSAFWCDNYSVALRNGQFSVVLGRDNNELKGKLGEFNGTTYVGVKVGTEPEMTPRQKLTSVAYAINAVNAVNAINGVPKGVIVMWSGTTNQIPSGWALCDGGSYAAIDGSTVITPNLTDRFVVGAGANYQVGSSGGEAQHSLSLSEMATHNHGIQDPGHSHVTNVVLGWGNWSYGGNNWATQTNSGQRTESSTTGISILNAGNGQPHENRPPYYALAYIIKL